MAWFRHDRERALDAALTRIYEAQSRQVEALSKFLAEMSELSLRRAASAMGERGSRVKKERKYLGQQIKTRAGCPLCRDPLYMAVTPELIAEHRRHEEPRQQPKVDGNAPTIQ